MWTERGFITGRASKAAAIVWSNLCRHAPYMFGPSEPGAAVTWVHGQLTVFKEGFCLYMALPAWRPKIFGGHLERRKGEQPRRSRSKGSNHAFAQLCKVLSVLLGKSMV